ncbi:MAG: hypothetical protein QM737_18240 [Ferruginibacter sp.]
MNKQIKSISIAFILISVSCFAYTQNKNVISITNTPTNFKSDSTVLSSLVLKLLKWHQADKKADFELLAIGATDSIHTGINWASHKERVAELEHTGFFSKTFIDNYQKIALHLDKELKQNKTKYFIGDLPPYGNEANEWCNCQDYPANAWKKLKIVNLKINGDVAGFKWTWGNNFFYSVKAVKENNAWRIAELERFTIKNFSW